MSVSWAILSLTSEDAWAQLVSLVTSIIRENTPSFLKDFQLRSLGSHVSGSQVLQTSWTLNNGYLYQTLKTAKTIVAETEI